MSREIFCKECATPLTGGLDTAGDWGHEVCLDCYLRGSAPNSIPCPDCDGRGEVDHNCDCDHCYTAYEECYRCGGDGILYRDRMRTPDWDQAVQDRSDLMTARRKLGTRSSEYRRELARLIAWNQAIAA